MKSKLTFAVVACACVVCATACGNTVQQAGDAANNTAQQAGNAVGNVAGFAGGSGGATARNAGNTVGSVGRTGTVAARSVRVNAAEKTVYIEYETATSARVGSASTNGAYTDGRDTTAPMSPRAFTDGRGVTAPLSRHAFTDGRGVTAPGAAAWTGRPKNGLEIRIPTSWTVQFTGTLRNDIQVRTATSGSSAIVPNSAKTTRVNATQTSISGNRFVGMTPGNYQVEIARVGTSAMLPLDTIVVSSTDIHPTIRAQS